MILVLKRINKMFKGMALLLTLCFLVTQPLLQNNYFLEVPIFEMTQNETEDDTEEEDRQEDEKEDEKNESIEVHPYRLALQYAPKVTNVQQQEIALQIAMDIHIPPPERA